MIDPTQTQAPSDNAQAAAAGQDLGMLANVKVRMTVEVGRTQISIEELLRLNEGAVVELDRLAGDPLDILVNGTQIATGEVVVIGDRFGIRFGDIVDPRERAQSV
jgi:flagellar motor switch protein FliN/FliY|nr:flagellar motor switch protein FliN [Roseicyclus sp. Amp-Y-6]